MFCSPLLITLADGVSHHITQLAEIAQCTPQQLNSIWQNMPTHIRPLLRQQDGGFWKLARPLALLPENFAHKQFQISVLPQTTSSNDVLLDKIRAGENIHKQIIAVHQQTAARGRQGKTWQTQIGECLMFSLAWTFERPQAQITAIAPLIALACQRALAKHGCQAQIKWPNDLVVGLDKLGGILIETIRKNSITHTVIGVGINFMQPENVENATSFQTVSNEKISVEQLFSSILDELHLALTQFEQHGFEPFQTAYESVHRDQAQDIFLLQDTHIIAQGKVLGVNGLGALRLMTEHGEQHIVSGEISLRRPEQVALNNVSGSLKKHYLLLDGGNSRFKWAWVEDGHIVHKAHAPYRDLSRLQQEWLEYHRANTQIFGSAVCGELKKGLVEQCLPRHSVTWLPSMPKALGMINHYRTPETHGADRWFNALGSRRFTRNACIVVSCGTAVTIDAVSSEHHYLGGSILPGFHLMREALAQNTAQLGKNEGLYYPFPTTTNNAVTTGMIEAVCGAIILMHTRLKERHPEQPVDVVLTGGGAYKIMQHLPEAFVLDNTIKIIDNLVIFGLLNWIEHQ